MEKTKILVALVALQMTTIIGYMASDASENQAMMDFFMIANFITMVSLCSVLIFKK